MAGATSNHENLVITKFLSQKFTNLEIFKNFWTTKVWSYVYDIKKFSLQSEKNLGFSPALREWESVGIQPRLLGNAAFVACLLLLCQWSKWLNGKSIWVVFRSWVRVLGSNPSWIPDFFPWIYFFTLSAKTLLIIHECLLSYKIKPLNFSFNVIV